MGSWFPSGTNGNSDGWRLDIVSLLAVIGESSMESHGQALTASWTCMLPRIIPAPMALLKSSRPTRLPHTNSAVVGVHNGTMVNTLNYFPNILHPLEDLKPLQFMVLKITHKNENPDPDLPTPSPTVSKPEGTSNSTDIQSGELESGIAPLTRKQSTFRTLNYSRTGNTPKKKPRIPPQTLSPLNILNIGSCLLTVGVFIAAAVIGDGTACLALVTISMVSSIVGYASWWSPVLTPRTFQSKVPSGDIAIRTREGAFLLVRCNENVARELYVGTEECSYHVKTQPYRILVGIGTFLFMVSVVLLGNCGFAMQAAIGASYIILNGAYWGASLIPKDKFWDLSNYVVTDITPDDAKNADKNQDDTLEGGHSFTRTLWYAVRETKKAGWVKKIGAAPGTPQWEDWLKLAETNADQGNRKWDAVAKKEEIVGQSDSISQARTADEKDTAEQHAPAFEIPPAPLR